MTPEQLKQLAQPVAEIYEQLTDELMENIAARLVSDGNMTDTAKWQIRKLAQAGELTRENIRLIAKRTASCPEMTEAALRIAAEAAVEEIEPALQEAFLAGVTGGTTPIPASSRMMQALQAYQKQAADTLNLINTVMAYKARDAYTGIVNKAASLANRDEYLQLLGKAAGSVVTGQQARQSALRQCIREFSQKGLPGFVDKAGREWSPEAYLNMDIRTTVNNVAHQVQFDRMEDYGCELIEVSSKAESRPRCASFQGRLYSRSNKSGYVEDLHGSSIAYAPWSSTSYGEAAGLLGINCGHKIYPFFPSYSVRRYRPYPEKETQIAYEEGQRQRYLERQVRASKRECAMLDKMGDREGFEEASVRLKGREAQLKDFTEQTGRLRKRDREQVYGFDRSVSRKATKANENLLFIQNDAIIKASSGLPKRVSLPDEVLKATAEVDLPNIHGVVPTGSTVSEVYVMAGTGTSIPIRDLKRLYALYPEAGPPSGWQKKSGTVVTENFRYIVHWYENNGVVPANEIKTKGVGNP
nr:MAG TPA: minor capsid protein [Caudoviricetes sp.]